MIKQIIFDYNGVISNDFSLVFECVSRIFEKFNIQTLTFQEFQNEFEFPLSKFYKRFLPDVDINEIDKLYFVIYETLTGPAPYKGIKTTLTNLKTNRLKLYIFSSHRKNKIKDELDNFNIETSTFNKIYGDVKNKAKYLDHVVAKYEFNPKETIYVGDTEHDMYSAKKSKLISVASTYGYQSKERLSKKNPDYYINEPTELLRIVDQINFS